jgi:hypothetical protein
MAKFSMAVFVVFVIFLTSCKTTATTTRFIFDESIPLEESIILENGARERFTVTHVNGIPVNWQKSDKGKIEMQIPAGNIELTMRIHIDTGNAYYTLIYNDPNAKIQYNFLVGNDYIIGFWPDYNRKTSKFEKDQYFTIINQTTKTSERVIIEKRTWEYFLKSLQ